MKQNKIIIRKKIFETNSSSSHSLSFGPEGRLAKTIEMSEAGVITVNSGDWSNVEEGGRKTNDPNIKLSYLYSYIKTLADHDESDNNNIPYLSFLESTVLDFTGANKITFIDSGDRIDHQSVENKVIDPRDLKDPEFIKEFIFNPGTWIYLLWDSDSFEIGMYEGEIHLLYTIILQDDIEIPVYYEEQENLSNILYNNLSEYIYDDKTRKLRKDDYRSSECLNYSGDFIWSNRDGSKIIKLTPKIVFPGDDTKGRD